MNDKPLNPRTHSPALSLALDYACHEALRYRHEYIACEHLLLAVVRLSGNIGTDLLKRRGIGYRKLHWYACQLLQTGPEAVKTDELPLTPRAARAISFAESLSAARNEELEADHLFLGIIRVRRSTAVQILLTAGITIEELEELSRRYGAG